MPAAFDAPRIVQRHQRRSFWSHWRRRSPLFDGWAALVAAILVFQGSPSALADHLSASDVLQQLEEREEQLRSASMSVFEVALPAEQPTAATESESDQDTAGDTVSPEIRALLKSRDDMLTELLAPKRFDLVLEGRKLRLEEWRPCRTGNDPSLSPFYRHAVFDGAQGKDFMTSASVEEDAENYPIGTIDGIDFTHVMELASLMPLAAGLRPMTWAKWHGIDMPDSSFSVDEESFGEFPCTVLRWKNPGHDAVYWELWIDRQSAGCPRRVRMTQDELPAWEISVTHVERHSGIDLPTTWLFTRYGEFGEATTSLEASVADISLNQPVGADTFSLVFPAGTVVTDLSGESPGRFIVREGRPNRPISQAEWASELPYSHLLNSEPARIAKPTHFTTKVFLVLNLILLVVVVWSWILRNKVPR